APLYGKTEPAMIPVRKWDSKSLFVMQLCKPVVLHLCGAQTNRRPVPIHGTQLLPPRGVQGHALVVADEAGGFQIGAAGRCGHGLAVPFRARQLMVAAAPLVPVERGRQ